MESLHITAPDAEDDLYSGFNEYPSTFSTKDIEKDEILQQALRSSYGKRIGVFTSKATPGMRFGTGMSVREPMTGFQLQDSVTRPMTAVRGAGYTSQKTAAQMFDPLNQASKMHAHSLEKIDDRPEDKVRRLERKITELIDESCVFNWKGDHRSALDKAKDASSKERSLIRMQEQTGLSDSHNLDLTFSVLFNLANQYALNEMYTESLNTYNVITKNKMFPNAHRLKVNMGNIYVKLGQYQKAVKMYRMALDQVPNTHKDLRIKITHNIGILFVKMGQYGEACSNFERIMNEKPDFKAGLHAIICYFAMDDKEKMRLGFQMLLDVPLDIDDEDRYISTSDDVSSNLLLEVIRNDSLRSLEREIKRIAERSILTAAKLIAPVIEDNFTAGYNWCVEAIKNSLYAPLAGDLEINRAVTLLKQGELPQAVDTLRAFEKKGSKVASTAATNCSFIYFLQGDIEQAEKSGEAAKEADGYNAGAYVNLGNCSLSRGELVRAKDLYTLALDNDASCVEAIYNLGLVTKQQGLFEESLEYFLKLHAIINHHPHVLYQLGHLHELIGDTEQAVDWFLQLLGIVPSDPGVLQKLGEIYDNENDKQQAYHYYFESYRHFPSNFVVLDWLGAYFVALHVSEKAVSFYRRAASMQPNEPKWRLLIGSCYRRSGNYQQALATYKHIHTDFPDNIECLKLLVRMCSDLGLKEASGYAMELKKAEKSKELRERIGSSRSGSRRSSGRSSRGGLSPSADSPLPPTRGGSGSQSSLPPPTRDSIRDSISSQRIAKMQLIESSGDPFSQQLRDIDASYSDPLGPLERPRTAAGSRRNFDDEFADEEIGDDLLPE
ncbi:intraflagellar transport protein 88 homolog [Nilaparvata lugens]|uniref:intraflagellar transport protein 88 homolog n=1 Tax=Nilaparvata lugens TaxID=108931 RepID=UPI00193DA34C|nr:intraflagellar transport protein 88 homolog [Nilaparvata lugens]